MHWCKGRSKPLRRSQTKKFDFQEQECIAMQFQRRKYIKQHPPDDAAKSATFRGNSLHFLPGVHAGGHE